MNAANRLLVVLCALAFIAAVVAVVVVAWAASDQSIDRMGDLVEYVGAHNNDTSRLVMTLGSAILILLAVAFVLLELAPPQTPRVEVRDVELGTALLATDAIARRLEQIVAGMPPVLVARAKVLPRGKGVDVTLNLHVDPASDVAGVADEASRLVQDALATKMRVELSRPPRIHLAYLEPPRQVGRAAGPVKAENAPKTAPAAAGQRKATSPAPAAAAAREVADEAEERPQEG